MNQSVIMAPTFLPAMKSEGKAPKKRNGSKTDHGFTLFLVRNDEHESKHQEFCSSSSDWNTGDPFTYHHRGRYPAFCPGQWRSQSHPPGCGIRREILFWQTDCTWFPDRLIDLCCTRQRYARAWLHLPWADSEISG